jgi:hypothetical protein
MTATVAQILATADSLATRAASRFADACDHARHAVSLGDLENALGARLQRETEGWLRKDFATDILLRVYPPGTADSIAAAIQRAIRDSVNLTGPMAEAELLALTRERFPWELFRREAADYALRRSAKLVADISKVQERALRRLLAEAIKRRWTALGTARKIRDIIGLDTQRSGWLTGYRSKVDQAIADRKILASRGDALVEQYRRRLLESRGLQVARSETLQAARQAQRAYWRGVAKKSSRLAKLWVRESVGVLGDGKICAYCFERHGWRARMNGRYKDGTNGPAWAHGSDGAKTNCRCIEKLSQVASEPGKPEPFIEPTSNPTLQPAIKALSLAGSEWEGTEWDWIDPENSVVILA